MTYLLNCSFINTTALIDEMSSCGRLAGIDVADNDTKKEKKLAKHVQIERAQERKRGIYTLT